MRSWPQTTFSALALFIGVVLLATPAMGGTPAVCGDFIVNAPGEECDPPGNAGQCPGGKVCSSSCTCPSVCGDSLTDLGEECDDGNVASGDCCSSTCQFEYLTVCRASAGACDPAEVCPIASATCPADAKSTGICRPAAGDCDVAESCNGVSNACPSNSLAPNGTSCDDGDVCTTPDQCQSGSCVGNLESCGNGSVEPSCGEECDDGNIQDGDGCSANCGIEGSGIPILPKAGLLLFVALLLGTSSLLLQRRFRGGI